MKIKNSFIDLNLIFLFLILIFFFVLLANFVLAIGLINEVMYNPIQDDNYNEWIEIYNPTNFPIDLTNWTICEDKLLGGYIDKNNGSLNLNTSLILLPGMYAIVSDGGSGTDIYSNFNISLSALALHVSSSSICGGLSNTNDTIYVKDSNQSLVDIFSYNSSMGANGDGNSLQRANETSWCIAFPTAGSANNCSTQPQQQQEKTISLSYPNEIECKLNFTVKIDAFNFSDGFYDVKVDILDSSDESHRIGKVWNGSKWLSTNSYVNSVLLINNNRGTVNLTYKIENFNGEAILRPRIRKTNSSSYSQFDDALLVVNCESQQHQEESILEILDAPTSAKFGKNIEIEIRGYRGNTSKYAVYVYIQDDKQVKVSNKITLHFDEKFKEYNENVELVLKCKNESGTYEIVAEGLGTIDTKRIKLLPCVIENDPASSEEEVSEGITIGDFTYFIEIQKKIFLAKPFQTKIKIRNNGDKTKTFLVWSYVYRGSKCYSCNEDETRESNSKSITLLPNSFEEAILENIIEEAEPGEYKFKVKILQQDLKTPKEFTYNITLEDTDTTNTQKENNKSFRNNSFFSSPTSYASYSGNTTVYTSPSFSLLEFLPYVLTSLALLVVIYLIITKI